jgi:hypothetical protein
MITGAVYILISSIFFLVRADFPFSGSVFAMRTRIVTYKAAALEISPDLLRMPESNLLFHTGIFCKYN